MYDFQGPFSIGRRTSASMAFGPITRLVRVNVDKSQIGKNVLFLVQLSLSSILDF